MKGQMAAMMAGAILAMSATTLPAFASGARTNTQPRLEKQQQMQVSPKTGFGVHQHKWSIDDQDAQISRIVSCERAMSNKFKTGIVEQDLSLRQAVKKVGVTEGKSIRDRSEKRMYGHDMMCLRLNTIASGILRLDR